MSSEAEELHRLVRETRQRLEALTRAGVDRLRMPTEFAPVDIRPRSTPSEPVAPSLAAPVAPTAPPIPKAAPPPKLTSTVPKASGSGGLFGDQGLAGPSLSVDERVAQLAALEAEVAACERCPVLSKSRTRTVFGTGSPTARLMFIGEGPGAEEDRTGLPFVGRAGELLTDMITKGMGLTREQVYIANAVKSRPPENRTPLTDEIRNCLPFLERQIEIIRPEFLCLLGKSAAVSILETGLPMSRLRGKWHRYKGIPTIVTWHPAYLLRTPSAKRETWEDLQILMDAMGIMPPDRKKK